MSAPCSHNNPSSPTAEKCRICGGLGHHRVREEGDTEVHHLCTPHYRLAVALGRALGLM